MNKHTSPLSPRVLVEFGNRNGVPYVCDETMDKTDLRFQVNRGVRPIHCINIGYPTLPKRFYLWTEQALPYRTRYGSKMPILNKQEILCWINSIRNH